MIQVNVKNSNKNCLTDDVEYKIYNQNGNNIELSPCKNVKIDIEYKINNISLLNNRQIDYFRKMGVDIFTVYKKIFNIRRVLWRESDKILLIFIKDLP